MKLLIFAGSLRADSLNKKNAREAARIAKTLGVDAEFLDLKEYAMPVYDGDIEANSGIPETTKNLSKKIAAADGLVISTPEYNGGIPGILKNVLDWLSRDKPASLANKHLLLLAASPGAMGGIRALWHTRQPFEAVGVHVFPNMLGLSGADKAFGADGVFVDEKAAERLKATLEQFIQHIKK